MPSILHSMSAHEMGGICGPQTWIFAQVRKMLGIDQFVDILEHIEVLPVAEELEAIRAIE